MLDTAQNIEKAFDKFHLFDDGFSAYQCSHLCEDGSSAGPLESDNWVNVRNVIEFLARFHEFTKKVSDSHYVTCNSHFEDVSELYCHLKMCLISEDEHLRKMAERMQEKFKNLALKELFGVEKGKKINAEVYAYMNYLFEEYLKTYSTGSCSQSPSSSTSSNNASNTSSGSIITVSLIRTKLHLKKQKEDNGSGGETINFDKAVTDKRWRQAMTEEIDSIEKNNTWELTTLPKGHRAIGVKWVYTKKKSVDEDMERYKARLVAKGYKQRQVIDYEEVYAPVSRMETIHLLISLAVQMKWKIHQLNVKSSFLNRYLEEEVYDEQTLGFVVKKHEDKVLRLKKALYGLKQSPRAWNR
uniref:Reverse transcriptase Ty1/copia-type domain-containing protein n=1 Tax=Nicotiana tabacum TaxID=4097 RepID=A0A1S4AB80_TOBAC|nr:PREDICTED: uncharacterized protein LOC107795743 [Nicotiana tabacum]